MAVRADTDGFVHELFIHDGAASLERALRSFGEETTASGEVAVVLVTPPRYQVARRLLADLSGIELRTLDPTMTTGASLLRQRLQLSETPDGRAARSGGSGGSGVALFTEVPHPGLGAYGDEWLRYEAGADLALERHPIRGVCAYDRRTTPREHLDELARCHPWWHRPGRPPERNPRYEPAADVWASLPPASPDPLETNAPALDLIDPQLATVREAVAPVAGHLPRGDVDDLLLAVNEVVANAHRHGVPPVNVRAWDAPDRVVVAVGDAGRGPEEVLTGLAPAPELTEAGGFGLWLAQQAAHITHARDEHGYTVRIATRPPGPPPRGATRPGAPTPSEAPVAGDARPAAPLEGDTRPDA